MQCAQQRKIAISTTKYRQFNCVVEVISVLTLIQEPTHMGVSQKVSLNATVFMLRRA